MEIRLLRPEEISVRLASVNKAGAELLLYKDARVDMSILDETFGPMNWKKCYSRDNKNCTVSVYDQEKQEWISKEDTGKESYSDAEKGLASDSFKRACFNWGIGVELYSSPRIFFFANNLKTFTAVNGKYKCYDSFQVVRIIYKSNRTIKAVDIENISTHQIFTFENPDVQYEMIVESAPVTTNVSSELM